MKTAPYYVFFFPIKKSYPTGIMGYKIFMVWLSYYYPFYYFFLVVRIFISYPKVQCVPEDRDGPRPGRFNLQDVF